MAQILVASPLADFAASLLEAAGHTVTTARDPAQLERALGRRERAFEVAVVDPGWQVLGAQWRFDGLDVVATLAERGLQVPDLMAAQGTGLEVDYLQEATTTGLFAGAMLKTDGPTTLLRAVDTILCKGARPIPGPFRGLLKPAVFSVHAFLSKRDMASHVAFAIATGRTSSWQNMAECIAELTGQWYNPGSLAKHAPAQFVEAFSRLYTTPRTPEHTKATVIYLWCGERRHYLLSWGRRHRQWHVPEAVSDRFPFFP